MRLGVFTGPRHAWRLALEKIRVLEDLGIEVVANTPEEFAAQIKAELQRKTGQQGPGRDRQGEDEGKPALLACHLRPGRP